MKIGTATKFAVTPEWVLFADISAQAVRAYGVLARFADDDGKGATPSFSTIAEKMRVSRATAVKAVGELRDIGAVTVRNRASKAGDQTSNEYVLNIVPPGQAGSQANQGGSQANHPGSQADHGGSQASHEPEPFNQNQENERKQHPSHAASLPAPEWGDLAPLAALVQQFASVSPPTLGVRLLAQLEDPAYWRMIDGLTEGTKVYYDSAFREYVTWLLSKPTSRQHKNLRKGFTAWVKEEIRREEQREARRRNGLRAVR